MRIAGVIAEYNPLHSGHINQLRRIREEEGADYIIVVMSGDFVQRGEPAIFDKYTRARAALLAGADLVIELPVMFATCGAPDFAAAATALLDKLNVVDELVFGSECGDTAILQQTAEVLLEEPETFKETLKEHLKAGETFSKAEAAAFKETLSLRNGNALEYSGASLFTSPNNILGVEYIKALLMRKSRIVPVTMKREGQSYHDDSPDWLNLAESGKSPSATAIRAALRTGNFDYEDYLLRNLPSAESEGLDQFLPVFSDDFDTILNEKILEAFKDSDNHKAVAYLSDIYGFTPELAYRLSHTALNITDFTGRVSQLKSRSFTYAHISRALLHLILNIRSEDVERAKEADYIYFARVLGFRESARPLFSAIHSHSKLPLITKTADAKSLLNADGYVSLAADFYAAHLYSSILFNKFGFTGPNEYTRQIIRIQS